MFQSILPEHLMGIHRKSTFGVFYVCLLLFSLHWAIVVYFNSSYLEQFVPSEVVGYLYIISALFTIALLLRVTSLLVYFGAIRFIFLLTLFECGALLCLAFFKIPVVILLAFVVHQAIVPVILFNLDVIMEEMIGKAESITGGRRGLFLTITSFTGAVAVLCASVLLGENAPRFSLIYIVSACLLVPFLVILFTRFRHFADPQYPQFHMCKGIAHFWKHADVRNVFCAHFLLQLFFAWMVIYTPLYLTTVLGFSWEVTGTIIFTGLLAYVLFEYVIGYVADAFIGEKEMMSCGFAIMGIATSWFLFLDESSVIAWMLAMFMTRVGASLVEVTTESYFFKHMKGKDTDIIGLFRIASPLSYVVGALLGIIALHYLRFDALFLVLGVLMLPGLFFAMALHDTK